MRILNVPARYAAFVEQTLAAMKATIDADRLLAGADSPWPTGTIPKSDARGSLMLFVAHTPNEMAVPAFPMVDTQPERMSA